MKTFFTFLVVFLFSVQQIFGVASSRVTISSGSITYYNWSNNTYDVTGHYLSIGASLYALSALTLVSGNMMVPAGGSITFSGLAYKTSMVTPNSVALWASNDTTSAFNMVDFVQWGAGGQPFEAKAVTANLWQAGDFIPGEPDYERDSFNFTLPMSNEWTALNTVGIETADQINTINLNVAPNPFQDRITVQVSGNVGFDVKVKLYSYTGSLIEELSTTEGMETEIGGSYELPTGIYFIRAESPDGSVITRKVLKL